MDDLLKSKKHRLNLILLLVLTVALPIGINLVKQQQNLRSNALAVPIEVIKGDCTDTRKGKLVLTCNQFALKLISPLGGVFESEIVPSQEPSPSFIPSSSPKNTPTPNSSAQTSPSPAKSPSPSPSPSPTGPRTVNVRSFNSSLQSAIASLAQTGGAIYLPAGTYTVPSKTKVPSNITIFGDGIGRTIIRPAAGVNSHLLYTYSEGAPITNVVIRDLTVQGPGASSRNSQSEECCHGIKFENTTNSYIINVESKNNGMDGIYLGFIPKEGTTNQLMGVSNIRVTGCKSTGNGRNGLSLTQGTNNLIDNCEFASNEQNGAVLSLKRSSYSGFLMTGNRFISNYSHDNADTGFGVGGCKQNQNVSNNVWCTNRASGNDKSMPNESNCAGQNDVYVNNSPEIDKEDMGPGTVAGPQYASRCGSLPGLPSRPSIPVALNQIYLTSQVLAESTQSTNINIPSPSPTPSPTSNPSSAQKTTLYLKVAESERELNTARRIKYSSEPLIVNFNLQDQAPGLKQIWVEFENDKGTKFRSHLDIVLVDKDPQIDQIACKFDLTGQNLNVEIRGKRLGELGNGSSIVAKNNKLRVLGWSGGVINAVSTDELGDKNSSVSVKVIRDDERESNEVSCQVGVTQIALGAKLFCREKGELSQSNVLFTFFDEKGNKTQEVGDIAEDGSIKGLKTKFEDGKNYTISLKAPATLRKNALFTASDGTQVAKDASGEELELPIGDIFPTGSGDGVINAQDAVELNKNWQKQVASGSAELGDFNTDGLINAFDWSCMRQGFGKTDDPIPKLSGKNSF